MKYYVTQIWFYRIKFSTLENFDKILKIDEPVMIATCVQYK